MEHRRVVIRRDINAKNWRVRMKELIVYWVFLFIGAMGMIALFEYAPYVCIGVLGANWMQQIMEE